MLYCDNKIISVSARGAIKHKNGKLIVGDFVETDGQVINSVYERKSRFLRPNVANVDCINIVISTPPKPDYILIDKMIITALKGGAEVFLTVNKSDIEGDVYNYVLQNYCNVVSKIFKASAKTLNGVDDLLNALKGKLCAFIGQSAVGKTSLINALFGETNRTGDISQKSQRGRQTTTYSEIYFSNGCGVVDTPGFSELICEIKANELKNFYPEFVQFSSECYYNDCKHINEPDCAVKEALLNNEISKDRYLRYIEIYKSKIEEEKHGKN